VAVRLDQLFDILRSRRRLLALTTASFAATLILLSLAPLAHAADRVYWMNGGATANRIAFANLDGSGGGNIGTAGAAFGEPRGIAIDLAAGKVFWTDRSLNRISFANLDGSGGGGALNIGSATVSGPNAAALNPAGGRIYWANELGNKISYASLNGSGGGDLSITGATLSEPIGPLVDPGSGRIYWANADTANKISYTGLNGGPGGDLNTGAATVANPHGLAIDPVTNRIYWANVGVGMSYTGQGISYANLDGSGGGDLTPTGATVSVPVGVAIDSSARRIYWANYGANKISSANLDGSGGRDLNTGAATLTGSRSPVLLTTPSGTGAPVIAGGSSVGSALSCSAGSWAGDLLGSWLYRAPQRLSYSWTRNGAAIPGATAASYTAAAAGDYRCIVTASNPAGSASQTSAARIVAAPSFGAKTQVTVRLPARRIPGRGPVKVVVANKNTFAVSARLSMRVLTRRTRGSLAVAVSNGNDFSAAGRLLAQASRRGQVVRSKSFTVGAHAKKRVKLKLSKPVRRLLKKKHKVSVRLTLKVSDPAGNKRTLSKKVVLRFKKKR
jgi:hypothetical protein